jgi:hypothetical protein
MKVRLTIRRDVRAHGCCPIRERPRCWRHPVEHAADVCHYRLWVIVEGVRRDVGEPVPQLAMAARAVEDDKQSSVGASDSAGTHLRDKDICRCREVYFGVFGPPFDCRHCAFERPQVANARTKTA